MTYDTAVSTIIASLPTTHIHRHHTYVPWLRSPSLGMDARVVLTPPRLNRPLTLDRTRPTAAISMAVEAEKRKGDEARCQTRGGGGVTTIFERAGVWMLEVGWSKWQRQFEDHAHLSHRVSTLERSKYCRLLWTCSFSLGLLLVHSLRG